MVLIKRNDNLRFPLSYKIVNSSLIKYENENKNKTNMRKQASEFYRKTNNNSTNYNDLT